MREWGLTPVLMGIVFYSGVIVPALTGYFSFAKLLLRVVRSLLAVFFLFLPNTANADVYAHFRLVMERCLYLLHECLGFREWCLGSGAHGLGIEGEWDKE